MLYVIDWMVVGVEVFGTVLTWQALKELIVIATGAG